MDLLLIAIVLAAFLGGVVSALLGWASSTPAEPLDRRFVFSLLAALLGGAFYAVTLYQPTDSFTKDLLRALLYVGPASDVLANRAIGAFQAPAINKALPAPTTTTVTSAVTETIGDAVKTDTTTTTNQPVPPVK